MLLVEGVHNPYHEAHAVNTREVCVHDKLYVVEIGSLDREMWHALWKRGMRTKFSS